MSDNHYRREIFYRFPDIYKYLFREEIMKKDQEIFQERLNHHHDELRWLYTELYHNDDMFAELCDQMYQYFTARRRALKNRDLEREKNPDWFRQKDMLGMMLYIDNFAGNIKGVSAKLPYLKECNVNCLHLMPFPGYPEGPFRRWLRSSRLPQSPPGPWYHGGSGCPC